MATIVGIIGLKGGVGKSSIARALAREAAAGGLKVKLADLDVAQGTCVDWQLKRLEEDIQPVLEVSSYRTAKDALRDEDRFDLVVLDAPGRTNRVTKEIADAVDLLVQPSGAGSDDLNPAIRTFHELHRAGVEKSRLAIVLSRIATEVEEDEGREFIEEAGYSAVKGCLREQRGYREAQNEGKALTETKYRGLNESADAVIQELVNWITEK